ncbi:hypothetical protein [Vibrio metschnikovii]|uniref:Uncharacterized protein n=1 Tax=Vibrio metschnikovii TaxID=28172 RepID=A0A9X0RAL3_VIBME|nr:hypothetical protein [Vibrio metschnikovii]MBC5851290.1 hypothetical protein [Vibrio metschnikovii]
MCNEIQKEKRIIGWILKACAVMFSFIFFTHFSASVRQDLSFEQRLHVFESNKSSYSTNDLLLGKHLKPRSLTEEEILLAENKVLEEKFRTISKQEMHKFLKASRANLSKGQTLAINSKSSFSCDKFIINSNNRSNGFIDDYINQFQREACRIYKNRFDDEQIQYIAYNAAELLLSSNL